jgi:predicted transcriptional regulator YheO
LGRGRECRGRDHSGNEVGPFVIVCRGGGAGFPSNEAHGILGVVDAALRLDNLSNDRQSVFMTKRTPEQQCLLEQIKQIGRGIGETFAPFCEVVVHDLLDPKCAILAIHNNLSGRKLRAPATELGLARISDLDYPQVVSNYANRFADGRPAKSTSVGIKDSSGRYVAALCMNIDLTLFRSMENVLSQFSAVAENRIKESLDPTGAEAMRDRIDQFAARLSTTPRSLKVDERRALIRELKDAGFLEVRRAMEIIALHLGVSRASVYTYAK